jgi:hypothetical protein
MNANTLTNILSFHVMALVSSGDVTNDEAASAVCALYNALHDPNTITQIMKKGAEHAREIDAAIEPLVSDVGATIYRRGMHVVDGGVE